MNAAIYPNVQRNDWHHSHDYTLWLSDSTQMRLTPDQYACLKSSIDKLTELGTDLADEPCL